jgi:HlyD family secretion protein
MTIRRRILIIVAVIAAVAVGVFIYMRVQQSKSAASSKYQTVQVKRDALVAIVGATGTVEANQTTQVGWQTSGRISRIDVKVGDRVKQGDMLAEILETSLPQSIILARADLVTARRNLDSLKESNAAKAQAQLTLTQAEKALTDAQDKRTQKNYQRASEATLDSARANYILAQEQVDNAEEAFSGVSSRAEDDPGRAAVLSQLSAAKQIRDRALANLNWLLGKPDANEVAQADAQVELAKARLDDARREWERLKNGADPEDISAAESRVAAIEATIALAHLEAPFAGVVTDARSKVGDQAGPGVVSFRIDDLSRLVVDVEVPEVDVNRVKLDQPAELSFDAVQGKTYHGKVVEVARIGTPSTTGGVNFVVTVELTDPDEAVLTGMTAAVNVIVSKLDNVLLAPNRAVRLEGDKRVVYLLKPGTTEPEKIEITIGASSDQYSEITGGDIKEGDVLVLNPPVQFRGGPPQTQ